ncbi:hypothetical protein ABNF97_09195 [Plantactinospora sp. B6F1]|uniref:hypothetical protein n=1 Tax=Plantactinospora sp. B6F1 TaxID=3158971 RepID=UPI0032D98863
MFKRIVRAVAVVVLAAGGAVVASMVPAMAYPNCERHVGLPVFDGNNISGPYSVD